MTGNTNILRSKIYAAVVLLLLYPFFAPYLQAQTLLKEQFLNPSDDARPWTFWYWMFGALSKEALTADLEAMKEAGLGGTYLMPIKSPAQWPHYPGAVDQLSPEWWEMVRHSINEADRLGLKLGMHICDGFALAGGPWFTPEESMQKVVSAEMHVKGGELRHVVLPQPETYKGYYEDIALLAYPLNKRLNPLSEAHLEPVVTTSAEVDTTGGFFRVNASDVTDPRAGGAWIEYAYPEPYTCRNVEIVKVNNNYQAQRLKLMASDDGMNFRVVKQLVPARQGWQNYDFNATHAVPPTTARYFRFYWNPAGSEPGAEDMNDAKWKPNLKVKDILLHTMPCLNHWEGKAGLVWRVAQDTGINEVDNADCIQPGDLIDLTSYMKDGLLTASLPEGQWMLLRVGHTATGHTNATGGGGKGLECDKFSPEAVRKQFNNWFAAVFRHTDESVTRRTLKYMHIDSWECGSQNWSKNFATEFKARRGYDLMPYLPLFAGIPVESATKSEQVLRDVRTTISELVTDVFYETMAQAAAEYDCKFSAECVAPTMVSDGLMHYKKVDLPMGEFWFNSPTHDKLNDMLDAVSGAHIYGKNIVQAEGFTQIRGTWDEHPDMMKPLLDRNYALGMNKLFYHVYVHNPYMDRKPGMTLDGIGFFFQRDQTWWPNGAKAFVDYAARCQALLQYGVPVVDIAVFTGEEMPRRAILPDRLVNSLPGLFGEARIQSEAYRLANEGQPLRTIAGVTHSANMADPEEWVNPLRGYAYDSFNADALLHFSTIKDGAMQMPGGVNYKVVVIPESRPMNPNNVPLSEEVRKKVEALKKAGVIIPELPYRPEDFSTYGVPRDVIVPANIAWTHRTGEEADIYFIANQSNESVNFEASLRISEGVPQLWNPVNGKITSADYALKNGRTAIALALDAHQSVFVVIPKAENPTLSKSGKRQRHIAIADGNWNIRFTSLNRTIEKSYLFDWSTSNDEQIKFYSGEAIYTTDFVWKGKPVGDITLLLEYVENVVTVRINGVDCGTLWTKPYLLDVTHALKKGKNKLEIAVTNTWANAILGADQGKAPFEGIWTNGNYRRKEKTLLPAGLFGSIELILNK